MAGLGAQDGATDAKLAEFGIQNGANMAEIIDSKIDHLFDASWDRFFTDFWLIRKAKIEGS